MAVGLPESWPDWVLKLAQAGLFWMAKVSALPSLSVALGWNEYEAPATTLVSGVPEMLGADWVAGAVEVAGAVSGAVLGPDDEPLPPQPVSPVSISAHRT